MFKVGDEVRFIRHVGKARKGDIYVISKIIDDLIYLSGEITIGYHCAHVGKVNDSPVREVMRREIVPGTYERVIVGETYETGIWFEISEGSGGSLILTAEELDNVAMIASQLAEALRDG